MVSWEAQWSEWLAASCTREAMHAVAAEARTAGHDVENHGWFEVPTWIQKIRAATSFSSLVEENASRPLPDDWFRRTNRLGPDRSCWFGTTAGVPVFGRDGGGLENPRLVVVTLASLRPTKSPETLLVEHLDVSPSAERGLLATVHVTGWTSCDQSQPRVVDLLVDPTDSELLVRKVLALRRAERTRPRVSDS